jgi:hypothetical protein
MKKNENISICVASIKTQDGVVTIFVNVVPQNFHPSKKNSIAR